MIAFFLLILGRIADIHSTKLVLDRGGRELNPLYGKKPSVLRMVLTNAVALAAIWGLAHYWQVSDGGQALTYVVMALASGFIARRNYRIAKDLSRK